ncbi:MAG: 23S rRNA (guanosine(2251)-2'-O)-methyltransferase RlmB [Actinobacteria bacterium]|nr:23S rRNA (guanosine(2251)-2'-O)-methyltransferase RlmB [Actinomycetota bacterium]
MEGYRAVLELLRVGRRRVHELWMLANPAQPAHFEELSALARAVGIRIRKTDVAKMAQVARTSANQGVVALADPLVAVGLDHLASRSMLRATDGQWGMESSFASNAAGSVGGPFVAAPEPFVVVVDGVTDPGNLGALLRSASAAGAAGVVLRRRRAVHITPTVTKAAAGSIEHLEFSVVAGIPAALAELSRRGLQIIGLDPDGDVSLFDMQAGAGPVAVVVGSEGRGLSALCKTRCDLLVAIPQARGVDSLNVSVATALGCYEVARRRHFLGALARP